MATLVTTTDVAITETRSRIPLLNLRSSHADVAQYNKISMALNVGETKQFTCDRFAYFHIRDLVNLSITSTTGTIALFDVSGSFSLPIKCVLNFSVPGTSTITLARQIDLVYG